MVLKVNLLLSDKNYYHKLKFSDYNYSSIILDIRLNITKMIFQETKKNINNHQINKNIKL